jgi:hypothetical protein
MVLGAVLCGIGILGCLIQPEMARKFGSLAVSMFGVVIVLVGASNYGVLGRVLVDGVDFSSAIVVSLLLEGLLIWAILAVMRRRGIAGGGELDVPEAEE